MPISIKPIDVPNGHRILVTSDIHGHGALLENLLDQAGFSDDDMLFILGDLIEKGPDNLASLRYVMELAKKRNVEVIMGNVDLLRMQMVESLSKDTCEKFYEYCCMAHRRWGSSIFEDMADELGVEIDSPSKALSLKASLLENFQKEWDFLRSLPDILETRNYIFVHGGLPTEDLESLKGRDRREVLKLDNFMGAGLCFEKYIVAGHWPVNVYNDRILQHNPIINRRQRIISIDGGCGLSRGGQLNLVIIPGIQEGRSPLSAAPGWSCAGGHISYPPRAPIMPPPVSALTCQDISEISFISCDQLPLFRAMSSQKASADPISLHFLNGTIRLLDEGKEFSLVEHVDSGRKLEVLSSLIYNQGDRLVCTGFTDYRLPVETGDRLSLMEQTSRGYFVKKNGVCGWYQGELRQATPS